MVLPSLRLLDIEDMSLREIDKRITFINKTKFEQKNIELKTKMHLLHTTIGYATNANSKNNSKFSKFLDKTFNNKPQRNESFDEVMNINRNE